jgi:upstream activation factor subunit UAF30
LEKRLIGEEQQRERERERERERSREGGEKLQEERRIMPPAAAGSSAVKASSSALTRVFAVSPALKKFLGVTEISRPETMKRIWSYIKGHQLQVGEGSGILVL